MKKTDLLAKEDIAREMGGKGEPLSIRSVERYIKLAKVEPAVKGSGRGKLARYARTDVEKIKTAHQKAAEERDKPSTALTTTKPATSQAVALVGELFTHQQEAFTLIQAALDSWSIWMTRAEALERTGLPASWFDMGVACGDLAAVGAGRGRRYHRADVRTFAERMREADYRADVAKRAAEKKSPQS